MKRIIWTLMAICSTSFLLACSKDSNNNNGYAGNCPGGSTPNSYGQCVNTYGQIIGLDPYGNYNNNILSYFADNWSNQPSITITNQSAYKEFLRTTMGVCDRMQNSGGTANCQNWVGGGLDIIMMNPNSAGQPMNVTVRAWPTNINYGYQAPGFAGIIGAFFGIPPQVNAGGYFNPMSLDIPPNQTNPNVGLFPINNSQGFEVRTNGPLYSVGNRSLIQVRVEQGKPGDPSFSVKFGFPNCVQDNTKTCKNPAGVWFAEGTFKRCQTAFCSTGLW